MCSSLKIHTAIVLILCCPKKQVIKGAVSSDIGAYFLGSIKLNLWRAGYTPGDRLTSWYSTTFVQYLYISCYLSDNKPVLSYPLLRLLPQISTFCRTADGFKWHLNVCFNIASMKRLTIVPISWKPLEAIWRNLRKMFNNSGIRKPFHVAASGFRDLFCDSTSGYQENRQNW